MNFDDIVLAVSEVCPKFNKSALRDFVADNIDNAPAFAAMVLQEGFKIIDADVEFISYRILSPEERVKFDLKKTTSKNTRPKIPMTVSHLRLVEYTVRFQDTFIQSRIYLPYLYEDMLFMGDKRQVVRKVLLEKTFSRIQEKGKDGLSVSPIRVNLPFDRRRTHRIFSYVTGQDYTHFIVTAGLYHGTITKKISETTILHYMLAKFGFSQTKKKFGFTSADVSFVGEVGTDTDVYDYFSARKDDPNTNKDKALFLKVKRTVLADDLSRKFIVNLMYVLAPFNIQDIDNVYVEQGSIWKTILGMLTMTDPTEVKGHSNAIVHLRSVDHFIDPITKKRFVDFGIPINDTYDLLVYIFINIDRYMVENLSQDVYNSRLDVANGIFVQGIANKMFMNIYYLIRRPNISLQDITKALRFNPMMFKAALSSKKDDSKHYIAPPDIIGDNFLFAGGLTKIRLGGKPEQRLHPSHLVVESINAFVGKHIGKTGYLNPFVPTDSQGAIVHPDYAAEIDAIAKYLPK